LVLEQPHKVEQPLVLRHHGPGPKQEPPASQAMQPSLLPQSSPPLALLAQ
jgi:hypothetical protein